VERMFLLPRLASEDARRRFVPLIADELSEYPHLLEFLEIALDRRQERLRLLASSRGDQNVDLTILQRPHNHVADVTDRRFSRTTRTKNASVLSASLPNLQLEFDVGKMVCPNLETEQPHQDVNAVIFYNLPTNQFFLKNIGLQDRFDKLVLASRLSILAGEELRVFRSGYFKPTPILLRSYP